MRGRSLNRLTNEPFDGNYNTIPPGKCQEFFCRFIKFVKKQPSINVRRETPQCHIITNTALPIRKTESVGQSRTPVPTTRLCKGRLSLRRGFVRDDAQTVRLYITVKAAISRQCYYELSHSLLLKSSAILRTSSSQLTKASTTTGSK